jgi:hypothetical protein
MRFSYKDTVHGAPGRGCHEERTPVSFRSSRLMPLGERSEGWVCDKRIPTNAFVIGSDGRHRTFSTLEGELPPATPRCSGEIVLEGPVARVFLTAHASCPDSRGMGRQGVSIRRLICFLCTGSGCAQA